MRLFSICAHFGEGNAVMWKAETGIAEIPDEVRKGLRKQAYVSNRAEVIRQMLYTQVEWPENTEILRLICHHPRPVRFFPSLTIRRDC